MMIAVFKQVKREGTLIHSGEIRDPTRTRPIFYFLGVIGIIGWLYILFMSDLFVINTVEVQGARSLDTIDVSREVLQILDERPVWRPWPARHAWFVDRPRLVHELSQRLFVANASVDKTYLNVLRLKMEERTRKFIFYSHQQYVWVDLRGTVLNELTAAEIKQAQAHLDTLIIHRDLDDRVVIGMRVADESSIKGWLLNASEASLEGMKYREFDLPTSPTSTRAMFKSTEGESVVVDTMDPMRPQIHAYMMFKKAQPKDLKGMQYVDVRVPGKVYVK